MFLAIVRTYLLGLKLWSLTFFFVFVVFLFPFNSIAQTSTNNDVNICKQLAIKAAQLADKSQLYSQSYFDDPSYTDKDIDTALTFIQESIVLIDSAITLASDSSVLAIEYANVARNYAIDSYNNLVQFQNNPNNQQKYQLSKRATFSSENATVEAYKASFYFKDVKKIVPPSNKQITKLDIDQTLFTLLKEELEQKKETNSQEISRLSDKLSKTNDPKKQSELRSQLEQLELTRKEFDKKSSDAEQKLTSINALIEKRDTSKTEFSGNEETIFSKTIIQTRDEWNKQIKFDVELPDGLVYQVQVGVYKNAILPEVFKGLTPIYGKVTEKGISYSTGLFEKLADAREAKNYVINMGFADAFIIAYNKKNKIPLDEAIKLEK